MIINVQSSQFYFEATSWQHSLFILFFQHLGNTCVLYRLLLGVCLASACFSSEIYLFTSASSFTCFGRTITLIMVINYETALTFLRIKTYSSFIYQ
jgi:hypothetical protein